MIRCLFIDVAILVLDAVKKRSHKRSSSTSDAFHQRDDLITGSFSEKANCQLSDSIS